ncbi:MAG: ArsR/SmtB family transcription factor [Candidatus Bipolaricaulaceae bacterium]
MKVLEETLVSIGQALSHPSRVRILTLLAQGERCGCDLAPILGLDPSVVSRHLTLLSQAGLIVSRRDGPRLFWRLAHPGIPLILSCLARLSCERRENDLVADHSERI